MKALLLIAILAVAAVSAPDKKAVVQAKERELEMLRSFVAAARDSLQSEIAVRWRAKQQSIERRETDREETERLRESQERAYGELSRVKEEFFARQRRLEDERADAQQRSDGWMVVAAVTNELYQKESDQILEQFPLDREIRRQRLEEARRSLSKSADPGTGISSFVQYAAASIRSGLGVSVEKRTLLPDDGAPRDMHVARFGSVFSYAAENDSDFYYIRQTGLLGPSRFATAKIGESELRAFLRSAFASWIAGGTIQGSVLIDVLQNSQSTILIAGQKVDATSRMVHWVKAGGPVMIPLLGLPLWALALIILKAVQFMVRGRANRRLTRSLLARIEKGEVKEASALIDGKTGAIARVAGACLDRRAPNRVAAEKRVKEILVDEVPRLEKHLSTLAVIAGIAPLLGLLGTVTGMINLFEVITHYGTGDPKLLAGGISEALITTEAGLIIAIPILIVHNALRNRADRIMADMEKHAICFLNRLWPEG